MVGNRRSNDTAQSRYSQIAEAILAQIRAGHYEPGQRLPSIRAFCRQHDVSIVTCERALQLLERRGLIFAIPRLGYYLYPYPAGPAQTTSMRVRQEDDIDWRCLRPNQALLESLDLDALVARSYMRVSFQDFMRDAPPGGSRSLRAAIVRQLHLQGFAADLNTVAITDGSMGVILHALHVIDRPGAVAVQAPLCPALVEVLRISGRQVIELDMLSTAQTVYRRLLAICDMGPVAAVMISPSCHAISGRRMAWGDSLACYRLCAERAIPVVTDDTMRYLLPERHLPGPFKAIDQHDIIIHYGSLARVLPGLDVVADAGLQYFGTSPLLFTGSVTARLHF